MKYKILIILFLSVFSIQANYAQKSNKKIKITGTVIDVNSNPVEGAIMMVDGIQTEVTTNAKGVYNIKVPATAKTLTVLLLANNDMKAMDINGKTVVDFVLNKAAANTAETVQATNETVDIGYGTSKKSRTSGSVKKSEIKAATKNSYLNIYEMIKTEVPGVTVNGTSIQLQQGPGSFNSSTEPLFVVDGTVVYDISNIIPSQVRSISLLKGSAASIYGSRGANGAIVITLLK